MEAIEERVNFEKYHAGRSFFDTLVQPIKCSVLVTKPGIDCRYHVRINIPRFRHRPELIDNFECFIAFSSSSVDEPHSPGEDSRRHDLLRPLVSLRQKSILALFCCRY